MSAPAVRPGIMEITPYVGGDSGIPGRKRVVRLASNEGALGPSPKAIAAYEGLAREVHRYPDGGCWDLRRALAAHHGIDAGRVVCGAGSDEIISLLCRAYVGPGDEVVYSEHGFLMYVLAARAVGATPVAAPEADLTADVDALLDRVGERTPHRLPGQSQQPDGDLPAGGRVAATARRTARGRAVGRRRGLCRVRDA